MKLALKIVKWLLLAFAACMLLLAAYVTVDDLTVELTDYNIQSDAVPLEFYGYRFICVADFHNSHLYGQIADIINERKPDAVLFLGDMASMYEYEHDNLARLTARLDDSIPLYGIIGNHEYFALDADDVGDVVPVLENLGINVLDDEYVELEKDGAKIRMVGVRDVWINSDEYVEGHLAFDIMRDYLATALDDEMYTILLAHRADLYPYLNDLDADLMLSGHMHGGQVRLPVVGALIGPNLELLPDYTEGVYEESSMTMVVSRGCGCDWRAPRVFNGPELVQITLRR